MLALVLAGDLLALALPLGAGSLASTLALVLEVALGVALAAGASSSSWGQRVRLYSNPLVKSVWVLPYLEQSSLGLGIHLGGGFGG